MLQGEIMALAFFVFVVASPDDKADHLGNLIQQADKKVNDFTASIVNCTSDNNKVGFAVALNIGQV